jgi:N-acylneuraminate cytidylyltransferase
MESIAIVPVRKGSKRLLGKNLASLYGKPLLYWALKALEESDVDKVFVFGDSPEFERVIIPFKKVQYVTRPPSTATDEAPTELGLVQFLEGCKHLYPKNICLLIQCTNPWIVPKDINSVLNCPTDVVSVAWTKRFYWTHDAKPNYYPPNRPRTQDYIGLFIENGAIYKSRTDQIIQSQCRISPPCGVYTMPPYTVLEIDEEIDIVQARSLCDHFKCSPPELRYVL